MRRVVPAARRLWQPDRGWQRHASPSVRHISSIVESGSFVVTREVRKALSQRKPVVALETAIYTHGFPQPQNLELAHELDAVIREQGAIPATIGIVDGIATVGLSMKQLTSLCTMPSKRLTKFSRRDLPFLTAKRERRNGGTTVAGTMALAQLAGIKFFATGGIGGVHQGAESTFDISADLIELGRTPVVVVCSGCKSFLDIPKTLEYLETQGVPVTTLMATKSSPKDFPAFWSVSSGIKSPMVTGSVHEAVKSIHNHFLLDPRTGFLLANPIPVEYEISKADMDKFIVEAVEQANLAGITGKDNTPFVLDRIKELSKGQSVVANQALVRFNAQLAASVAKDFATSYAKEISLLASVAPQSSPQPPSTEYGLDLQKSAQKTPSTVSVVVAGAVALDHSCDYAPIRSANSDSSLTIHTSNPAKIRQSLGGVGYNVARAAHLCGGQVQLFSKVGDDLAGQQAKAMLQESGVLATGPETVLTDKTLPTAQYVAINDLNKDLFAGAADMRILESVTQKEKDDWKQQFSNLKPNALVIDGNWSSEMIRFWLQTARSEKRDSSREIETYFEPVSTAKAVRLISALQDKDLSYPLFPNHLIDNLTGNELELSAMWSAADDAGLFDSTSWRAAIDAMNLPFGRNDKLIRATSAKLVENGIPQKCIQLLPLCRSITVSLGSEGVMVAKVISESETHKPESQPYIIAQSEATNADPKPAVSAVYLRRFPSHETLHPEEIQSVNGAGDTFLGATVVARTRRYEDVLDISNVDFAQKAACMTLRSTESVNPEIGKWADRLLKEKGLSEHLIRYTNIKPPTRIAESEALLAEVGL